MSAPRVVIMEHVGLGRLLGALIFKQPLGGQPSGLVGIWHFMMKDTW